MQIAQDLHKKAQFCTFGRDSSFSRTTGVSVQCDPTDTQTHELALQKVQIARSTFAHFGKVAQNLPKFLSVSLKFIKINHRVKETETASLENDATNPSDASHDATSEGVIAYATLEDIRDYNYGEYKFPNATWTLRSSEFTDRVDEPAREAPLALTQQALQRHNAKNISADGKTMNKYHFDEHHMEPMSLGDTAAYASTLDGDVCLKAHVEPYSYPRQHSKHHLSIALAKMDDQKFDADIGLLFPPVEYQGFYTYPTCINEVNLYDHVPEPEFYNDPSNTKPSFSESSAPEEVSFQVLNPWSDAYAGIGTQFSS
ncbi:hypothetical protein L207DRAFT_580554 [Hyaloscypha variabilis F]|uniref:Uncharacterized protein n=1 Tax=Hyaloscypha variabilis (strain UAMH 11265 / GT02V1 / F) TaxID=1149755 RepID=A0A2J6RYX8_HYAVF|nr:hypothetical protein L207DRAFT_580554 [Hyaloscypha variabilis F]